jgi:hypothetical protein
VPAPLMTCNLLAQLMVLLSIVIGHFRLDKATCWRLQARFLTNRTIALVNLVSLPDSGKC